MTTWADLGQPATLGILIFWGLFVICAVFSAFTNRDQRTDIKTFFHRMMDPREHHHSGRGYE